MRLGESASDSELVEFCYDGRCYMSVRADCVDLLRRGWRLRLIWLRQYDRRELLHRLWYLLSASAWGVGGSEHEPDYRVLRAGPLYLDYVGDRELACEAMRLRAAVKFFVRSADDKHQQLVASEAKLRELQRAFPSARGGAS